MTRPEPDEIPTEASLTPLVLAALTAWLALVLPAVMATALPNPSAIFQFERFWIAQVDRLMPYLARLARRGWLRTTSELGSSVRWDPQDPYLEEILAMTRNLLVRVQERVYRDVIKTLATGRDRGEGLEQLRNRVNSILNISGSENWPNRALVIARTEVARFNEAGALAAARRVEQSERSVVLKQWDDRDDDHVRRSHVRVDNELRRLGEPFQVGRSSMQQPLDPRGAAQEVVNCVPGSAVVQATDVEAIFRFEFEGPVLTLRGKSGLTSTVSVNHPIVTEFGWLPACQVQEGMYLLRTLGVNGGFGVANPDPQGAYATIEEVYNSLSSPGLTHGVVALPVNFYGDIPTGQVDVVFTNRPLGVNLDAENPEEFGKFCLSCSDLPNPPDSPEFQTRQGVGVSTGGIMGSSDLGGPGLRSHPGPLDRLGLGLSAQGHPSLQESGSEGWPADSLAVRQLLDRSSGQVFLDEIIEVVRHDFAGHLYTLQTTSGIYIADNTVSHNCRCRLRYVRMRNAS